MKEVPLAVASWVLLLLPLVNAVCLNCTVGQISSGFCNDTIDDVCLDINECANKSIAATCTKNAYCSNSIGSYNCLCFGAYYGDGISKDCFAGGDGHFAHIVVRFYNETEPDDIFPGYLTDFVHGIANAMNLSLDRINTPLFQGYYLNFNFRDLHEMEQVTLNDNRTVEDLGEAFTLLFNDPTSSLWQLQSFNFIRPDYLKLSYFDVNSKDGNNGAGKETGIIIALVALIVGFYLIFKFTSPKTAQGTPVLGFILSCVNNGTAIALIIRLANDDIHQWVMMVLIIVLLASYALSLLISIILLRKEIETDPKMRNFLASHPLGVFIVTLFGGLTSLNMLLLQSEAFNIDAFKGDFSIWFEKWATYCAVFPNIVANLPQLAMQFVLLSFDYGTSGDTIRALIFTILRMSISLLKARKVRKKATVGGSDVGEEPLPLES